MDKNIVKDKALQKKRRRVRKSVSGDADRPRLSVFRSERHISCQVIDDECGKTLVSASSLGKELRASLSGMKPTEVAGKIGEAVAEKALAAGVTKVVFDRNGRKYTGRIQALADGARSKGLQF